MKSKPYSLLLHPFFLISLFLLLLNDISLKYEFHNGLTGKLSDFTGLFVFALFLIVLIPHYKIYVLVFCGLFFIWWKSILSTPFIDAWNDLMPILIDRVIDYSDLSALLVLPLAFIVSNKQYDPVIRYRRFWINFIGLVSIFAFCFTSPPRYALYYTDNNGLSYHGGFETRKSEEELIQKLKSRNIIFYRDSSAYYPLQDREYYYKRKNNDTTTEWVRVNNSFDSTLYIKQIEDAFIVIPSYKIDDTELVNVKISYRKGDKKNYVSVRTFEMTWHYKRGPGKLKRKIKRHFKELFQ